MMVMIIIITIIIIIYLIIINIIMTNIIMTNIIMMIIIIFFLDQSPEEGVVQSSVGSLKILIVDGMMMM
jgi:hypothetical protein